MQKVEYSEAVASISRWGTRRRCKNNSCRCRSCASLKNQRLGNVLSKTIYLASSRRADSRSCSQSLSTAQTDPLSPSKPVAWAYTSCSIPLTTSSVRKFANSGSASRVAASTLALMKRAWRERISAAEFSSQRDKQTHRCNQSLPRRNIQRSV